MYNNPSKQQYNPVAVIHQRFRESNIQVVTEGPQAKPNKVISNRLARKCEIMANSWLMSPETGQETFLKAQIAVSEVLADSAFNTAVFRTPVACTKQ